MDPDEDLELQQALAMSLQEFNRSQGVASPSNNDAGPSAGPSKPQPKKPTAAKQPSSKMDPPPPKQRRSRKLPTFSPTEEEVRACFQELISQGRSSIRISDIVETGNKLGLALDDRSVGAMLEYLGEHGIATSSLSGGLSLEAFKEIVEHFRTD